MTHDDVIRRLNEELARHRGNLQALDGVVGSGIGLPTSGKGGPTIQIFVPNREDVSRVETGAAAVLGHVAFEVVTVGEVVAGTD